MFCPHENASNSRTCKKLRSFNKANLWERSQKQKYLIAQVFGTVLQSEKLSKRKPLENRLQSEKFLKRKRLRTVCKVKRFKLSTFEYGLQNKQFWKRNFFWRSPKWKVFKTQTFENGLQNEKSLKRKVLRAHSFETVSVWTIREHSASALKTEIFFAISCSVNLNHAICFQNANFWKRHLWWYLLKLKLLKLTDS